MAKRIEAGNSLRKMASKGFRGYPIATLAFYGPDDKRASKVAVGIIEHEGGEAAFLERWYSDRADVRSDPDIARQISDFIRLHGAKSVVVADRIMGCPHEEGKDYPEGSPCPVCTFWTNRDRFSGEVIQ
jgi:hypothetical protein